MMCKWFKGWIARNIIADDPYPDDISLLDWMDRLKEES